MAKDFSRKGGRFEQLPTVLLICEDAQSCKRYLEDAKVHFRAQLKVEVCHSGYTNPKGIVKAAQKKPASYEEIYCVIDHDNRQELAEAIKLCQQEEKIKIIASYPCYEYWLLLHFSYTDAGFADAKAALKALCKKMPDYKKDLAVFQQLLPNLPQARKHAEKAYAQAQQLQLPNPSTQMHLLLDRIQELGQPIPVNAERK